MNDRAAKKFRRGIRHKINDASMMALKKEIFRLARHRDILGIVSIAEGIAIIVLLFMAFR
jgi:hypothetical protein